MIIYLVDKIMNNLNLFQIGDITSLPEEPNSYINYYKVNNKLDLLEIDLSTGDKIAIEVAKELYRSLFNSVVYLLRSELKNVIRYKDGLQIFSNTNEEDIKPEINLETKKNYDYILGWENVRANLIFTAEYKDKTKPSEDIFHNLSQISFELYNNCFTSTRKDLSIFASDSTALKLSESEKFSLWKLCYSTFYLNYVNALIDNDYKPKIIIPFNDGDIQIAILQDLFSNVTFNRKFISRYNNVIWSFHIWGEISALYSDLVTINDGVKTFVSEVNSCNNDIDELPLVNIITNSYIS